MGRRQHWELPLEVWEFMEPLLPKTKSNTKRGGRPPVNRFKVAQGIFYVLSTGIQWKALPKEYGAASTVHNYFQIWTNHGVFSTLWREGLIEYDEEKKLKINGRVATPHQLKHRLEVSLQAQTRPTGVS